MYYNTLPIYWGNKLIEKDFNTRSFLNYYDFESEEALIERIIEIDNNDEKYLEMLEQPWFNGNKVNEYVDFENIYKYFDKIINTKSKPVSSDSGLFNGTDFNKKIKFKILQLNFKIKRFIKKIREFHILKLKFKIDKMRGK